LRSGELRCLLCLSVVVRMLEVRSLGEQDSRTYGEMRYAQSCCRMNDILSNFSGRVGMGVRWLITCGGGGKFTMGVRMRLFFILYTSGFNFFLSCTAPIIVYENISVFCLTVFNSVTSFRLFEHGSKTKRVHELPHHLSGTVR